MFAPPLGGWICDPYHACIPALSPAEGPALIISSAVTFICFAAFAAAYRKTAAS